MKTVNFIAITKDGQQRIGIPVEMVDVLNNEFNNHPDGVPMTAASGKIVNVLALILPTKALSKHRPVMVFNSDEEEE